MLRLLLALTLVVTTLAPSSGPSWRWPIAAPHPVVRPFVAPSGPYAPGHRGIDIGATGTSVYAPADGIVHFAGTVVDRPVLSIEHPGGFLSSYEPVVATVAAGTAVTRGQLIGTLVTGHCASLCLHFGVRLNGEYISPLTLLGGIPLAVLLPPQATAGSVRASDRRSLGSPRSISWRRSGQTRAPPRRPT